MDVENVRAWIELFDGRLEKIEQIVYGIPPLRVPSILERTERVEQRTRRIVWTLALCTSIIWFLTTAALVAVILSVNRGAGV